jgi:phosphoribosylformylglycinamidine synthase
MRFGIAVFPGTWSDRDCAHAVQLGGHEAVMLWHRDRSLQGADCVILPGGFAPLMESVQEFAAGGGLVWGICNGFQILCEAHMLPGALVRNGSLQFRCEPSWLRVETTSTPFTASLRSGQVLQIPVSHGEGRYVADEATLYALEASGRVAFRYVAPDGGPVGDASPNGSLRDVAGIVSEGGNVLGMMPHPERACEPLLGSADGMELVRSVAASLPRQGAFA